MDFAKLLKHRSQRDEDACLEFVTKNGMTFLSPVSDREALQVTSHGRWEQAFRVFSNIMTTKYPLGMECNSATSLDHAVEGLNLQ